MKYKEGREKDGMEKLTSESEIKGRRKGRGKGRL